MKIETDELKEPVKYAAVGATAALVASIFIPATAILGLGAIAAGGAYAYFRHNRNKTGTTGDGTIDIEPTKEKENGND